MVRKGLVLTPGEEGPELLKGPDGTAVDAFDAFDRLSPAFRRVYVVDFDGLERNQPQLDLWPELARDADLWIDAGVPVADQAIDILVSGARRAILSTSRLRDRGELERAWGLSQDLAFEVEVTGGRVPSGPDAWKGRPVEEVASEVRTIGPQILVVSHRGEEVEWGLIERLAALGPTWVGGAYALGSLDRVRASGARGGIFHPRPAMLTGDETIPAAPATEGPG